MTDLTDHLAALLRERHRILIFTGAGISTPSGIPDFRGPNGLWKRTQPVPYPEFMTSEASRVRYWEDKLEGWPLLRDAVPNAVHLAVADLERAHKLLLCVTQNIDGLHAKASLAPEKLVEIHGSGRSVECQRCHATSDPEAHFAAFARTRRAPLCACGGYLKPATVSFGQNLRAADLERAFAAANECDLVIAMGSTLSVHPAASVPLVAARRGVPYAIINQGQTDHDDEPCVTLRLEGEVTALFAPAVRAALA